MGCQTSQLPLKDLSALASQVRQPADDVNFTRYRRKSEEASRSRSPHLRPGDLGVVAVAEAALGDKVVDAAHALLVAAVPVLDRRVLDFRIRACRQLHHRRMQLQARMAQESRDNTSTILAATAPAGARAEVSDAAGALCLT